MTAGLERRRGCWPEGSRRPPAASRRSSCRHPLCTTPVGLPPWVAGRQLCPRRSRCFWLAQAGQTASGVEVVGLQVQGLLVGDHGRVLLALNLADQAQARKSLRQGGRGAGGVLELFGGVIKLPRRGGHHGARLE